MENCSIKKGFFVLQDCSYPAVGPCKHCEKIICAIHNMAKENPLENFICVDCFAEHELVGAYQYNPEADEQTQKKWYETTRRSVWAESHFDPFDSSDYDSFDRKFDFSDNDDSLSDNFFDS